MALSVSVPFFSCCVNCVKTTFFSDELGPMLDTLDLLYIGMAPFKLVFTLFVFSIVTEAGFGADIGMEKFLILSAGIVVSIYTVYAGLSEV